MKTMAARKMRFSRAGLAAIIANRLSSLTRSGGRQNRFHITTIRRSNSDRFPLFLKSRCILVRLAGCFRGSPDREKTIARTLLYDMEADNWTAPSGIGIRELVWGLLTVARRYMPETGEEEAGVEMLLLDGDDFLEATRPED